jgi:hypothetical protein
MESSFRYDEWQAGSRSSYCTPFCDDYAESESAKEADATCEHLSADKGIPSLLRGGLKVADRFRANPFHPSQGFYERIQGS